MCPRPSSKFKPQTNRVLILRMQRMQKRVARAVEFMDRVAGYGWRRRMEKVDRYMDQDYPRVWLSGRKLVSNRNLQRFEDYCRRFGYTPAPDEFWDAYQRKHKPDALISALNSIVSPNPRDAAEVLEKSGATTVPMSSRPIDATTSET